MRPDEKHYKLSCLSSNNKSELTGTITQLPQQDIGIHLSMQNLGGRTSHMSLDWSSVQNRNIA